VAGRSLSCVCVRTANVRTGLRQTRNRGATRASDHRTNNRIHDSVGDAGAVAGQESPRILRFAGWATQPVISAWRTRSMPDQPSRTNQKTPSCQNGVFPRVQAFNRHGVFLSAGANRVTLFVFRSESLATRSLLRLAFPFTAGASDKVALALTRYTFGSAVSSRTARRVRSIEKPGASSRVMISSFKRLACALPDAFQATEFSRAAFVQPLLHSGAVSAEWSSPRPASLRTERTGRTLTFRMGRSRRRQRIGLRA